MSGLDHIRRSALDPALTTRNLSQYFSFSLNASSKGNPARCLRDYMIAINSILLKFPCSDVCITNLEKVYNIFQG